MDDSYELTRKHKSLRLETVTAIK